MNGDYYFVNGNNLCNGKIIIKDDTKRVSQIEYNKYKKNLNQNTILVSINGTLGNIAFYNNENIILGKSACYFNLFEKQFKDFMFFLLSSEYFKKYASENDKTDLQEIIKQTKSKILDLAIHSKLVPQDPNDEPAEELLKRIATSDNREKSKDKSKIDDITDEEIKFSDNNKYILKTAHRKKRIIFPTKKGLPIMSKPFVYLYIFINPSIKSNNYFCTIFHSPTLSVPSHFSKPKS
ncbi:MAG: hypothetical protein K5829_00695 [Treponema sp.]|nr:hypothetical protein [Treponema sp.]